MESSKRNNQLFIDAESLSTLALVQEGLIHPVDKLMTHEEAVEVRRTKMYKGVSFPFPFLLTPSGTKNEACLKSVKKGDVVQLIHEKTVVGELTVDETFDIDPKDRLKCIYGTDDPSHPGVKNTMKRLGNIAVTGDYHVNYPLLTASKKMVQEKIKETDAKRISALILAANPLHRAHERMIRQVLDQSDLVVIFLLKPFSNTGLRYDIRYDALLKFIESFLPANKVMIVPLENSYIFAGYNELILDALVAKNYGCLASSSLSGPPISATKASVLSRRALSAFLSLLRAVILRLSVLSAGSSSVRRFSTCRMSSWFSALKSSPPSRLSWSFNSSSRLFSLRLALASLIRFSIALML